MMAARPFRIDGGKNWTPIDNQPTAQFYHVATDIDFPYNVYGAQQDEDTIAIASDTADPRIDRSDWHEVGEGESGYVVPDPTNPDIVYTGAYFGGVSRYDHGTGQQQRIPPGRTIPTAWAGGSEISLHVDAADCSFSP